MENLNKRKLIPSLAAIAFCFGVSTSANASIALDDYGFNVDGSVAYPFDSDPVQTGIDLSLFNDTTGLGTIKVTISGDINHYFGAVFDHEITETGNSFFNESGFSSGTPNAGQSWEIDEPGFAGGDIDLNLIDATLDNSVGFPVPEDVSMAIAWDFVLALDEMALITFAISDIRPTGGFFLTHHDPDSNESIYLSSTLAISAIPVPAAVWLFGAGLIASLGMARRRKVD